MELVHHLLRNRHWLLADAGAAHGGGCGRGRALPGRVFLGNRLRAAAPIIHGDRTLRGGYLHRLWALVNAGWTDTQLRIDPAAPTFSPPAADRARVRKSLALPEGEVAWTVMLLPLTLADEPIEA